MSKVLSEIKCCCLWVWWNFIRTYEWPIDNDVSSERPIIIYCVILKGLLRKLSCLYEFKVQCASEDKKLYPIHFQKSCIYISNRVLLCMWCIQGGHSQDVATVKMYKIF